jgi:glyoxylate/hydroxypyruvate reductase A
MNLLYVSPDDATPWRAAVAKHLPDATLLVWGEDPVDLNTVDYALTWMPEPGLLARMASLKAIFNLGAGVDALLRDTTVPQGIPIVRLVDPRLSSGMTEYVAHWVLHFHRDMPTYARQQAKRSWVQHENADTRKRRIGFSGLGELGQAAAHTLLMLGFESIAGWSRSEKFLPRVESFVGAEQLDAFLARTEILVSLLPNTAATRGILNKDTLAKLPRGAFIINGGRGSAVVDDDLIQALNSGHLAGAALDVFNTEPLPHDHPYWSMNNVFITPHVASLTTPDSAMCVIAEGINALQRGGTPANLVNLALGY